jgi:2-hydroxy-3-keto-5-methylthiopentenyl-1-phosphate phosphatase
MPQNNISLVWDFDGTLTPEDSTSILIEYLTKNDRKHFWDYIVSLRGGKKPKLQDLFFSEAPIWTYSLARFASDLGLPLDKNFLKTHAHRVPLYNFVPEFLRNIKRLENTTRFKKVNLKIHHFIVSAGLKEFVEEIAPKNLITWTWGCRFRVLREGNKIENVPVYCMDETLKTRAIFEISKGTFKNPRSSHVNDRVGSEGRFSPFSNFIYIGDGFSDVPALSLVRKNRGMGIVVYDPNWDAKKIKQKLGKISKDNRADLITNADYSKNGELYQSIEAKCMEILQRYEARVF